MLNSKEKFEDYQEGGAFENLFGKKKPPPAPTPLDPFVGPFVGPQFLERPTAAARRQAQEAEIRKTEAERIRVEAEKRKKYGVLSGTSTGRSVVDVASATRATLGTLTSQAAKKTTALMTSKPQLRDINISDANMFNDNNTPITPTDFTITYNNLMEEIKNIENLNNMQKGEKVLKELKILRSLAGESFTNTEKCITEIFDKLASLNEQVLLGEFDISTRDTLKNGMYAISDRHFNNNNTIISLIMDYVDKNRTTISDLFVNTSSGIAVKRFYMTMLIIIFYPKIILNMISDKMIDSIFAIKEKRDELLADGDDNINSIIEGLFGKPSSDYRPNYASIPASRGVSFRTVSSNPSHDLDDLDDLDELDELDYLDDTAVQPRSLTTTRVGGAVAGAVVDGAVAADGAVAVADGDGAVADGDGDGDGAADPAGAAPVGADGDGDGAGDLSSRSANPLISFLNSDDSYMKQSGLIFYNALTNFAVSIGIYKGDYQEQIANKLRELIKTKFKVIDPDNEAGTDYTNLKEAAQQIFNDAKSALEDLSDGQEYLKNEKEINDLQPRYDAELANLTANSTLKSNKEFMDNYKALRDELTKLKHKVFDARSNIEDPSSIADNVVDYLNAKLALDIASKKPDIQREISKALFLVLKLGGENTYHIFMNDMYKHLSLPDSVNGNYTLALNKYITSGIGKSIMFQFNVPKSVDEVKPKSSSIISGLFSRKAKGGKRGTRRYKKRAGTRRQKKRRGTHRKRKNTTK